MSAVHAAAQLDRARARRLTAKLRNASTLTVDLLTQVFDGQAWVAMGYAPGKAGWLDYLAREVPELAQLMTVLPRDERDQLIAAMRGTGMSIRALAAALGLSVGTVHGILADSDVELATVTSLDGRQRPAKGVKQAVKRRRTTPRTDRLTALIATAGPEGMTVVDVCDKIRWPRHVVAPALTRLADAERIQYLRPERRGQFGRYVAAAQ